MYIKYNIIMKEEVMKWQSGRGWREEEKSGRGVELSKLIEFNNNKRGVGGWCGGSVDKDS